MFGVRVGQRLLIVSVLACIATFLGYSRSASAAVATSKKFSLQGFVSDLPDGAYNMRLTFAGGNTTPAFNVSSVHVANGVFSVELDATVHTALNPSVFYSSTGSGNIQVKLEIETAPSVMEDFGFIPLTSVANAWVASHAATAETAVTAGSALMLSGVTVNLPVPLSTPHDAKVLKYNDTTKMFELANDNAGAGNPTAGTGIVVNGSQVSVDAGTLSGQIPMLVTGGKLAPSMMPSGTMSGAVVVLDGNGKVPSSMIYSGGTMSGAVVVLDGNGKIPGSMLYTGGTMSGSIPVLNGSGQIPASYLPALAVDAVGSSNIAADSINTAHIADGQVTSAKLSTGVQTALNGKLDSAGGTMSGSLYLMNVSDISAGGVLVVDANRKIKTATGGVLDSELGMLLGATANVQSQLNAAKDPLSLMPVGYVYTSISPTSHAGYYAMDGSSKTQGGANAALQAALGAAATWFDTDLGSVTYYVGATASVVTNNKIILGSNPPMASSFADNFDNGTITYLSGLTSESRGMLTDGTAVLAFPSWSSSFAYSPDEGANWTLQGVSMAGNYSSYRGVWSGSRFVIATDFGGGEVRSATPANVAADNWTVTTTNVSGYPEGIASDGAGVVVLSAGGNGLVKSSNHGGSFSTTNQTTGYFKHIAYANSQFCAIGSNSEGAFKSSNGTSWSAATNPPRYGSEHNLRVVGSKFVWITGDMNSQIQTYISDDCTVWGQGPSVSLPSYSAFSVAVGSDLFFYYNNSGLKRHKLAESGTNFRLPLLNLGDGLFRHVKY